MNDWLRIVSKRRPCSKKIHQEEKKYKQEISGTEVCEIGAFPHKLVSYLRISLNSAHPSSRTAFGSSRGIVYLRMARTRFGILCHFSSARTGTIGPSLSYRRRFGRGSAGSSILLPFPIDSFLVRTVCGRNYIFNNGWLSNT